MGELVGIAEIRDMLGGVSRARAGVIASRRDFPQPYQTLRMGQVWLRADVETWIREHRPHLDVRTTTEQP
ncbi:hypothetical protein O7606_02290 [Micromonospora sp. WMMD882]|uniref:hypothetical protein n=1 Tax=Micromonospora sp. WMMD882 TaxID=3015151 RepID=UPI00248C6E3F|nr:hypothetical protein [Micromonospora sp. WMMD882]WBB82586.1 hypothetical protein O7606_02290 [Micromonospora sp. WMMD882]